MFSTAFTTFSDVLPVITSLAFYNWEKKEIIQILMHTTVNYTLYHDAHLQKIETIDLSPVV